MNEYTEHAPSPRFARYIECYWKLRAADDDPAHRVLPDGCADIIFSAQAGEPHLRLVGTMTSAQEFALPRGQELFGVRFRPAMWSLFVPAPWPDLTDRVVLLEDVIDKDANRLVERLGVSVSVSDMVTATESWLGVPRDETVVHRIADHVTRLHGQVRIDDIADDAGLSPRQFRRLFVSQTGVTPKQLCRVLRFRHSLGRLQGDADGAELALDCGYYDQAHWINEFRDLSGYTPGQYLARARMAVFSNHSGTTAG